MKVLYLLILLSIPAFLLAQNTEGKIIYKETMKLKIELPEGPDHDEIRAMLPESQSSMKQLLFNDTEALYSKYEASEDDEPIEIESSGGDFQFKMVMAEPENRLYQNHSEGTRVHLQEFFGRKFRIVGDMKDFSWKLTGEQKTILDYPCQKATYSDSTLSVEAWFCPQIPLPIGPEQYGKLPGMILEVVMNDGERSYTATDISFEALPDDAIEAPTKGKEVTPEEFAEIVDEKMKEMEAEMGGNGTMKIEIRN